MQSTIPVPNTSQPSHEAKEQDVELGLYQCGCCKAEYSRVDHLIRHVRSHTQQRPYVCPVCSRGFARQDLLKRHETIHNADPAQCSAKRPRIPATYSHRVQQACRSCAAKKLKCSEEKPCKRCKQKQIPCNYDHDGLTDERVPSVVADASQTIDIPRPDISNHSYASHSLFDEPTDHAPPPLPFADGALSNNTFRHDVLEYTSAIPGYGCQVDFESDASLQNMDFSFLDASWINTGTPAPVIGASPAKSVALGSEAYRGSEVTLSWDPRQQENSGQEHPNLALPNNVGTTRPPSRAARRLPQDALSVATRDRILSMILETTSPATTGRFITSFPTTEILTNLIHHAFVHIREKQLSQFIHLPSFRMNAQRPELLAALIAYGAVVSPSIEVRKFGYAMQEAVRVAIQSRIEQDNANLRELGLTQAFYLQLTIAYYSGMGRKIEMAESLSMLGVTMLRRGKKLRKSSYRSIVPDSTDSGDSLHQQWLHWVEQESMKRLVYFAVTLDAHISMARSLNTLFSYNEIGTPLPTSLDLWSAESAPKWQDLVLSKSQTSAKFPPSLAEVMREITFLTEYQHNLDLQYGALVVLGGLWSLIREFRQMTMLHEGSRSWHNFSPSSRHTELCSVLQHFRMDSADWEQLSPEVQIMQELVSMHLYVSHEELSNYAGRGGEEEAQKATSYVERWFQSPDSRSAVWHGGQVFRAVKRLAPSSLFDMYAIALYHAAVVLWVYGLMKRKQGDSFSVTVLHCRLDGEEGPDLTRFLNRNRGCPGVTSKEGTFVALLDPASVSDLVNEMMQDNWQQQPFPVTTDEIFRLLQGFGAAIRRNIL
ncbi:hypothetical protein MMC13_001252 [Lambiella insularis]|nr:hypothetical protein [Lambiella insularis]